jgi:hypothetical protein
MITIIFVKNNRLTLVRYYIDLSYLNLNDYPIKCWEYHIVVLDLLTEVFTDTSA